MLVAATCPRRPSCRPDGRGYIVPEASHLTVASDACSGRVLVAEHQVMSSLVSHNSDLRNFVSQSKRYIKGLGDQKHPLLQDGRWHLCWSVNPFVYAVIAASEPETTLDMSQKIYFLREPNSVSSLMSYDQILKSSEKC